MVELKTTRTQELGKKFIIPCYIEQGSKPFKFEWKKNGRTLLSNNHQRIETSDDMTGLTIDQVDSSDSGNFSCIVSNSVGFDSQFTVLLVKGRHLSQFIHSFLNRGVAQYLLHYYYFFLVTTSCTLAFIIVHLCLCVCV